jgi:Na+/H+ antiporter NhaC
MKKEKKKISATKLITAVIAVPTLGTALYIMAHGLGLIDSLDFGAGAYYYADIPEFHKLVNGGQYVSGTPMWALILLFLIWGFIMYRLWVWLERRA